MLVLGRKTNETVRFPGLGITITLCSVSGKGASIGIDAPRSVEVIRGELEGPPPPETSKSPKPR